MTVMNLLPPIREAEEPFVGGYGHVPSKLMIVLPEAPLTQTGIMPATDKSMGFFRRYVQAKIWKSVYITPLVKYRRSTKAKTLYAKDIRFWLPALCEEIKVVNPERILVMGKFVSKYLIPNFQKMREDHGSLFTVRGEEISPRLEGRKFTIVPTFSFQDMLRDPMSVNYSTRDLQRFSEVEITVPKWSVVDDISTIPIPPNCEITIDTETTGLDLTSKIKMIGVGYDQNETHLFIAHDPSPKSLANLFKIINEKGSNACFHNSTFDWAQLINNADGGMPPLNRRINDTMVNAHLSGAHIRSLKHLTSYYTDLPGPHSGGGYEDEQYLAEDVRSTMALAKVPKINLSKGTYADGLYHDLAPILVDMRLRGVYINRDLLMELSVTTQQKLVGTTQDLITLTQGDDINWNSAGQVSEKLLECGVPLSARTKTGALSVSEPVLEELKADLKNMDSGYEGQFLIIDTLLKYRAETKLVSGFFNSYLEFLDEYGLLYPNLRLLGTKTGRLSCSDPNLQQVPREGDFKLCFEPRWCNPHYTTAIAPGYYGLVDFSGAELRMAAIISGDRRMAEFILAGDPHCFMARLAFPSRIPEGITDKDLKENFAKLRKASKKTTFGKMYDGTNKGLALKNGLPIEDIESVERALHANCPDLMAWIDKTKKESIRTKMTGTMFGNQRNLLDKLLYEGEPSVARAGLNTPIQGASGILALVVLRKLHQLSVERNLVSRPIFGVHDSILSEIAEHELEPYGQAVKDAYLDIENSPIVDYPVYHMLGIVGDLEIGRNWANVESTNEHTKILDSVPCGSQG